MTTDLSTQIEADMKSAMRAKDTVRLSTIRMLRSAIKQREIDERITLNDNQIAAIITKMIKQRKDASTQFKQAGRPELADKENAEIDILTTYLPAALSEAEVANAIQTAITSTDATSMRDMGKVIAILKKELEGRADMSQVSKLVKDALS